MYTILKNEPLPPLYVNANGRTSKYPFAGLEVGDCFSVPADEGYNMRRAASIYGIRNDIKLACRKQEDGSVKCYRLR